jgi:carbamate kinase
MGYMVQQCLSDAFHERGLPAVVVTLVTQTVVDPNDPAFDKPSKPVGEMISESRVSALQALGWTLVKDERRGAWRRVVASPEPQEVVEADAVRALVEDGVIVVAAGGGGIPVVQERTGILTGLPAVVDKDLASALLASDLAADGLLILTDVEAVMLNYGSDEERALGALTVEEARRYLSEGQFPAGSMGPKVEALARFVESTGKVGIVASISGAERALAGEGGTRITA